MLSEQQKAALLAEIAEQNGGLLQPDRVVEAAQAASHPLHAYFEWRDGVAAHEYRIDQARALIRSVRIEVQTNTTPLRAPQWIRSPDQGPRENGYVRVTSVIALSARLKVLRQELDRAIGAVARLSEIAGALRVGDEYEAAQRALIALRARLRD